ncbi:MAG TPA: NUDIX hydrolase [Acidimicrobiales bacterium]|nr:NUDIX hydrolase [Acidimicrobiales bacterium]
MTPSTPPGPVRAAGGVVWRRRGDGAGRATEILLVHRPKYDDWSLPKGKAEPGETDEDCALREVEEETGLRCALGEHLGDVAYRDRFDRPKVARYWAMVPESGAFEPNSEVDEVRWLALDDAMELLSYGRDRSIVQALVDRPPA